MGVPTRLLTLAFLLPIVTAFGIQNYPNLFFQPEHVVNNDWFFSKGSAWSRSMCQYWADELMEYGPWSVTNKTVLPASGDPRDYLSWAVYYWPDCSSAGNTTVLTDEEIWTTCEYVRKDGQFMTDITLIQNSQALINVSNSIYLSALAYISTNDTKYSTHVNHALHTFFVNNQTKMNPNLNYAQVVRGPGSGIGKHTGVLDMTVIAKVISGVQIMQTLRPSEWLQETEDGFLSWATDQLNWLETSELALGEKAADNNHGTFYYNQITSLYAFVGNYTRAIELLEEFYNGIYLAQINAIGDQFYESMRTRPYHYRAYNLMALVTNARIGDAVGLNPSGWERMTGHNSTMIDALNYAMVQNPNTTDEQDQLKQLGPVTASIINHFGDPSGKYSAFLYDIDPYYIAQPWFALNENVDNHDIKWGVLETTYGPVPAQPTVPPPPQSTSTGLAKRDWQPRGSGPMTSLARWSR